MQFQEVNSPFNQEQAELLNRLLSSLTESQKIWLSGYLAAPRTEAAATLDEGTIPGSGATVESKAKTRHVTLLFGSHTGNCQSLAEDFTSQLKERNVDVTLSSMDDFKTKNLKKVEDLLILTSTHGDGDPPDNALSFYDFLFSKRAPKLDGVRYSVLSLGDSSYEFFCQTGKDIDQRLKKLGAERMVERVDCDLDFEEPSAEWFESVFKQILNHSSSPAAPQTYQESHHTSDSIAYSKANPFQAEILENINLNGRGSNKETRHLELDIEGSNLEYEPGDSLGILPENDSALVDELLEEMGWNPEESVTINKQGDLRSLREALLSVYEITNLTKPIIEKISGFTEHTALHELLKKQNTDDLKEYMYGRDLLDFVKDFGPFHATAPEFVQVLRKIPARLYSIASSSKANPDEVHLTIGALRYEAHGRSRSGVCSVQCAERSEPGGTLPVYIQKNPNFKLPEDDDAPLIMIGAGTGVAPYRAFIEEREESNSSGKSWLFFGEQHFVSDFLYQIEWQDWLKEGLLTKMDVAFSRDTDEKVYVQNRLLEKSKEVFQWIEEGAYIYVCGDEQYMAKDVQNTLLEILETEGNKTPEQAKLYLQDLRKNKRYQRDVY
ncbi:assimilatory sulfite reductase (NADPH) flavoprotein subunit [Halobacillus yeomjeoni]|uniref:assimilatory sulfite reductase (NADPH) n=1 Tax=Halobacillus yeomjeoni TaxID=311194 RepID=A0A931HU70_9BACI|nr:assimilatory sulfite reductase (NADPH) flavoprotein subunit [Halobacillus yeomjeoni]MBH0229459.1 assimilatory sulfite reductase (NADPH) flavoprotein subunit [Halobacillus yeomjeoni]